MFNNWIAQGLGKATAILAWALGGTSAMTAEIGEFVSGICRSITFASGAERQVSMVSSITTSMSRRSGLVTGAVFISGISRQLSFECVITWEEFNV